MGHRCPAVPCFLDFVALRNSGFLCLAGSVNECMNYFTRLRDGVEAGHERGHLWPGEARLEGEGPEAGQTGA